MAKSCATRAPERLQPTERFSLVAKAPFLQALAYYGAGCFYVHSPQFHATKLARVTP